MDEQTDSPAVNPNQDSITTLYPMPEGLPVDLPKVEAIAAIKAGLALLHKGDVVELRSFSPFTMNGEEKKMTTSGFYSATNLDELAADIYAVNSNTVFVTMNPIRSENNWMRVDNFACAGSAQLKKRIVHQGGTIETDSRLKYVRLRDGGGYYKMRTTDDGDILSRRWVLLDIDAGQDVGTNSSDAEKQNAWKMALAISRYLVEQGVPLPALCDSSNGYHLLIRVDLPPSQVVTNTVQRFLQSLAKQFDGKFGKAHLDVAVFNLARIVKAYGSISNKGANTPERPWRRSSVLYVGSKKITTLGQLEGIADEYAPAIPLSTHAAVEQVPDVEVQEQIDLTYEYLERVGIEYQPAYLDGFWKMNVICPNAEHHTKGSDFDTSTIVTVGSGGGKGFRCDHDHCRHLSWDDIRSMVDERYNQEHPHAAPFQWSSGKVFIGKKTTLVIPAPNDKYADAVELLKEICNPHCAVRDVQAAGEKVGISARTLRDAYAEAGVTCYGDGFNAWLVRHERVSSLANIVNDEDESTVDATVEGQDEENAEIDELESENV